MEHERPDADAYEPDRRYVCTHQMAALFCTKLRHVRHRESMTLHLSDIRLRQSIMHINLKNNPPKFHPDPIETKEPWAFKELRPNKNKMSSDMGSVPDTGTTESEWDGQKLLGYTPVQISLCGLM